MPDLVAATSQHDERRYPRSRILARSLFRTCGRMATMQQILAWRRLIGLVTTDAKGACNRSMPVPPRARA